MFLSPISHPNRK